MSLPTELHRLARREYDDSQDYYESQQQGLGLQFFQAVEDVLQRMASNPRQWPEVYKKVREAPVPNWPFSIYYRVQRKQIVVISVFHHARNPDVWKSRTTNGQ